MRDVIIIEENHGPKDEVILGSRVTVIEEGEDGALTPVIVGTVEADPANGRISNESPLGQALMARKVGERVTVQAPTVDILFQITAIV